MTSSSQRSSFHQVESYAQGRAVLRSKDFVVEDFAGNLAILQEASGIDLSPLIARISETPFFIEGEAHRNARRRIARFFSPASVAQWEETIDSIIDLVVSPLEGRDQVEIYDEVLDPITLHLRVAVFGLPDVDLTTTRSWDQAVVYLFETLPSLRNLRRLQDIFEGMAEVSSRPPSKRFPNAPASLRETLRTPPKGMEPLSEASIATYVGINTVAGSALTAALSNVIAGVLLEPEGLRPYTDDETLDRSLSNHIRLGTSPLYVGRRLSAEKSAVIPEACPGEPVRINIRDMNRDPDYIEEGCPHALQKAAQHVGFGAGAHICPGLSLSQLVTKRVLRKLALRMPGLRLCGEDALQTAEHGPVFLHNRIMCNLGSTNE